MAALLRSVATKMPRIPSALDRHGLLPTTYRFSTSAGSTPPANLRGPQTGNKKKFLSARQWDRVKTTAIETATTCALLTVFGGVLVICGWRVNPPLDRINGNLEASNRLDMEITDELNRRHQRICKQCGSTES